MKKKRRLDTKRLLSAMLSLLMTITLMPFLNIQAEEGTLENSTAKEIALGGITANAKVTYDDIQFGADAQDVNLCDIDAVSQVVQSLTEKLEGLSETGMTKSAYTITYARNYDQVTGSVNLERVDDKIVGGFDKGEALLYKGLDFNPNGAAKLRVRAANGRVAPEYEYAAKLRFWYGDSAANYIDVVIEPTGGWNVDSDIDVDLNIPEEITIDGVKDIKIELVEGAIALHSFTFFERINTSEIDVTSVTLNKTTHKLVVGDIFQLAATIKPDNATNKQLTWSSSNQNAVTVSQDGLVSAVSPGSATITATAGNGISKSCQVTVEAGGEVPVPANELSLAGAWELKLGTYSASDGTLSDTCTLPGTLDENRKGTKNSAVDENRLNRKYKYTGYAVYQKQVDIPADWAGKTVIFTMERTKLTTVWVNGIQQTKYNSNNTLGTAQVYTLSNLNPGQKNKITVQVRNDGYADGVSNSHMITEETVTNWNGIIGEIKLKATDPVYVKNVKVYPNITAKTARTVVTIAKNIAGACEGNLTIQAESYNHEGAAHSPSQKVQAFSMTAGESEKNIEFTYEMGDSMKLWSEFHPSLYHMTVNLAVGSQYSDTYSVKFGMREFKANGTQFTVNGKVTFLRGEGNSAVFPLTGYPYMTKEAWTEFFSKAQELGINFFRFHSWTPPKAAFDAADELGIYMQPELYGFGGSAAFSTSFTYFTEEAKRILDYLASNPSFIMMTWGNELTTDNTANRNAANTLRTTCKSIDNTRLYAEGTNNNWWGVTQNTQDDFWTTCKTKSNSDPHHIRISFSWPDAASGGWLESTRPRTDHTYNSALANYATMPIMNHEAGQYQALPNFDEEIPKYSSGIFEARNLKAYRNLMESKGLLYMNETFSNVSARVSAIGYRADIETALRSSLAGYQLLSIQDFPGQGTAHVGILDNFMEDKEGGLTKAEYKNFNSPVTVLGELPKLLYKNNENLTGKIVVVNYSEAALGNVTGSWKLKSGNTELAKGTLTPKAVAQGGVTDIGTFAIPLSSVTQASRLTLEVGVDSIGNKNSYNIWVYPKEVSTVTPANVVVTNNMNDDLLNALNEGKDVLYLPSPTKSVMPNSTSVRWTTDYWSRMFHKSDDNSHTMGMYIKSDHPIFANFPTEYFNDYQWYNLMKGSRALIMDDLTSRLEPMAWNIDHMVYGRKLGSLFEAKVGNGKLIVCTFDLLNQINEYPEAKQLYSGILRYMESDQFQPDVELTGTTLKNTFNSVKIIDAYHRIDGESYTDSQAGSLKQESGTEENAGAATAVGGIASGDWLKYSNVDFGRNGAVGITLNGANANAEDARIEIRLGSNTGPLLTTADFKKTSGSWTTYKSQTFEIPRTVGTKDIVLVFLNGSFAFNYLQFTETDIRYMNPYEQLEPEAAAEDIEITDIDGGSYNMMQNYVSDIKDQVEIKFNNVDFGENGSDLLVIRGRALGSTDVKVSIKYQDTGGNLQSIPIIFRAGKGESYELSSETFYAQTFVAQGIKGEQNLIIAFEKGTWFDLESLYFLEYGTIDERPGDTTELETLIDSTNQLKESEYTPETWNILQDTLIAANESLLGNPYYTQAQINDILESVQEAIAGLKKVTVIVDPVFLPVTIQQNTGGTVTANLMKVEAGKSVTLMVTPRAGYKVQDIRVNGKSVMENAKSDKNGVYTVTITNIQNALTVTARYQRLVPAKNSSYKIGYLWYKVTKSAATGGTVTVTGATSKSRTSVTIPKTVNISGYTFQVTAVGNKAFNQYKKLKTVKIGDFVKKIGTSAFANCRKLNKVTIGRGLTFIGGKAFYKDKTLKKIIIKSTKLKTVKAKALLGISKGAVIRVPKKKVSMYRKKFANKGQVKSVKIK